MREVDEMFILGEVYGFKRTLKQSAHSFMFFIEVHGITGTKFMHEPGDSFILYLSEHEVIVISHKRKHHHFHQGHPLSLRREKCWATVPLDYRLICVTSVKSRLFVIELIETVNEPVVIPVIQKDITFLTPAVIDMIDLSIKKFDFSHNWNKLA
jgi:hypothetical protein